jgi:hypothetical protein
MRTCTGTVGADEINTPNQREIVQLTLLTCQICIAAGHWIKSGSLVDKTIYHRQPHSGLCLPEVPGLHSPTSPTFAI